MEVKICGIRTPEEAIKVGELRPSAIGILVGFQKTIAHNMVSEEQARNIVEAINNLPYSIDTFLLTEDDDPETNIRYADFTGVSHLQLTGDISPSNVKKVRERMPGLNIVKVVHIIGPEAVGLARQCEETGAINALLLDTMDPNATGGTGRTHDWSISREIVRKIHLPVWLAGGLKVTNLQDAIDQVQPFGVDVETGVQNTDGSKNYELIKEFIEIARGYSNGREILH